MPRVVVAVLVFVLSGVPAAAIVCDLLVCPAPASSSSTKQGCHDHGATGDGDQIAATTDGCAHLTVVQPFVPAAAPLIVSDSIAAVLIAAVAAPAPVPALLATVAASHGPPLSPRASHATPLRI